MIDNKVAWIINSEGIRQIEMKSLIQGYALEYKMTWEEAESILVNSGPPEAPATTEGNKGCIDEMLGANWVPQYVKLPHGFWLIPPMILEGLKAEQGLTPEEFVENLIQDGDFNL